MKITIKDTLEANDLVVIEGTVYRAECIMRGHRCTETCHLYDMETGTCRGTCYRWHNGDGYAFRRLLPTALLKQDAEVVETSTWHRWDAAKQQAREKALRAKVKEPKKTGPKPRGGVVLTKEGYRARIMVEGERQSATFATEHEALAWLEMMKEEKP